MEKELTQPHPERKIVLTDAILIIVGIVVGAGIFRAPSLVAANTGSDSMFFLAWILGGMLLKNWLKFFCYICTMRMSLML